LRHYHLSRLFRFFPPSRHISQLLPLPLFPALPPHPHLLLLPIFPASHASPYTTASSASPATPANFSISGFNLICVTFTSPNINKKPEANALLPAELTYLTHLLSILALIGLPGVFVRGLTVLHHFIHGLHLQPGSAFVAGIRRDQITGS
jgi:hypothetical protein